MAGRNNPDQKNRFLLAQARAQKVQRTKRERRTKPAAGPSRSETVATEVASAVAKAAAEDFTPDDHTVAEVVEYVKDHPDAVEAVVKAEKAGKARSTVLALGD